MQRLRSQVDQIDRKILSLLLQRTKLSTEIGETKRLHGVEVYAPEREHALLAHLRKINADALPAAALTAIYREIISSSRAAQGQMPIGLLKSEATSLLLAARHYFGGSDHFTLFSTWRALAAALEKKQLTLALLTGKALGPALRGWTKKGAFRGWILAEIPLEQEKKLKSIERCYAVTGQTSLTEKNFAQEFIVLIECKITVNKVKSLFKPMASTFFHQQIIYQEDASLRFPSGWMIVQASAAQPYGVLAAQAFFTVAGTRAGLSLHLLGAYLKMESHGG